MQRPIVQAAAQRVGKGALKDSDEGGARGPTVQKGQAPTIRGASGQVLLEGLEHASLKDIDVAGLSETVPENFRSPGLKEPNSGDMRSLDEARQQRPSGLTGEKAYTGPP